MLFPLVGFLVPVHVFYVLRNRISAVSSVHMSYPGECCPNQVVTLPESLTGYSVILLNWLLLGDEAYGKIRGFSGFIVILLLISGNVECDTLSISKSLSRVDVISGKDRSLSASV